MAKKGKKPVFSASLAEESDGEESWGSGDSEDEVCIGARLNALAQELDKRVVQAEQSSQSPVTNAGGQLARNTSQLRKRRGSAVERRRARQAEAAIEAAHTRAMCSLCKVKPVAAYIVWDTGRRGLCKGCTLSAQADLASASALTVVGGRKDPSGAVRASSLLPPGLPDEKVLARQRVHQFYTGARDAESLYRDLVQTAHCIVVKDAVTTEFVHVVPSRATASYDYEARSPSELSVSKGEELRVYERFDSGWCIASREGEPSSMGALPLDYVVIVKDARVRGKRQQQVKILRDVVLAVARYMEPPPVLPVMEEHLNAMVAAPDDLKAAESFVLALGGKTGCRTSHCLRACHQGLVMPALMWLKSRTRLLVQDVPAAHGGFAALLELGTPLKGPSGLLATPSLPVAPGNAAPEHDKCVARVTLRRTQSGLGGMADPDASTKFAFDIVVTAAVAKMPIPEPTLAVADVRFEPARYDADAVLHDLRAALATLGDWNRSEPGRQRDALDEEEERAAALKTRQYRKRMTQSRMSVTDAGSRLASIEEAVRKKEEELEKIKGLLITYKTLYSTSPELKQAVLDDAKRSQDQLKLLTNQLDAVRIVEERKAAGAVLDEEATNKAIAELTRDANAPKKRASLSAKIGALFRSS